MIYRESKVYFDGSHYIAIPHTNRPPFNRRKPVEEFIEVRMEQSAETVAQSTEPVCEKAKEIRTATAEIKGKVRRKAEIFASGSARNSASRRLDFALPPAPRLFDAHKPVTCACRGGAKRRPSYQRQAHVTVAIRSDCIWFW